MGQMKPRTVEFPIAEPQQAPTFNPFAAPAKPIEVEVEETEKVPVPAGAPQKS